MLNTLESLFILARKRKSSPGDSSYTNKLLNDKLLSKAKVLEEINELVEAVEKDSNKIHEAADVFYHLEKLHLLNQEKYNLLMNLKPSQTF